MSRPFFTSHNDQPKMEENAVGNDLLGCYNKHISYYIYKYLCSQYHTENHEDQGYRCRWRAAQFY